MWRWFDDVFNSRTDICSLDWPPIQENYPGFYSLYIKVIFLNSVNI